MTTLPAHRTIDPRVLYFGTPVVLVSTINEDGSANLAPMSSAWWVGDSCMLGLDSTSQTTRNVRRTGEAVLNLAHSGLVGAVDRLAKLTGTPVVPGHKLGKGYRYCADKFAAAGLTAVESELVAPPRVVEAPIHLEARIEDLRSLGGPHSGLVAVEATVLRTHVLPELLIEGSARHIDPERWDPLIMKFTHYYGQGRNLIDSSLAEAWDIPSPAAGSGHRETSHYGR